MTYHHSLSLGDDREPQVFRTGAPVYNGITGAQIEHVAQQMHKDYRAAFKALHRGGLVHTSTAQSHDHGWSNCHRKQYFLRRARKRLEGEL
ncbi:Uncharacterised protein [uncultured archaeon]|nr:Uncharacterised protein [uncultured archaeon]